LGEHFQCSVKSQGATIGREKAGYFFHQKVGRRTNRKSGPSLLIVSKGARPRRT